MEVIKNTQKIEAWQWKGMSIEAARVFIKENNLDKNITMGSARGIAGLVVPIPFGAILVKKNHWLLRGNNGIYTTCSEEMFRKEYSEVGRKTKEN